MKRTITTVWSFVLAFILLGCARSQKQEPPSAVFALGEMHIVHSKKEAADGYELSVRSKYRLRRHLDPEESRYFQYELGKHMKLVSGTDTIGPALSFYVPLINDREKEINCKYLVGKEQDGKALRLIVEDNLYQLDKLSIQIN